MESSEGAPQIRRHKHRHREQEASVAPEQPEQPVDEPLTLPNLVFERQIEKLRAGMQELRLLQRELEAARVLVVQTEPETSDESIKAASKKLRECTKKTQELEASYSRDVDALSRLEQGLVSQVRSAPACVADATTPPGGRVTRAVDPDAPAGGATGLWTLCRV